MGSAGIAIGIDVGGTFTDLAAIDDTGCVHTFKVLSHREDRAAGVLSALDAAALPADRVAYIAHGTTVVTNLLLERAGARVVGCATKGFTDLLELRRQERAALYDLTRHHPAPLVNAADVVPVDERMGIDGVLTALTPSEASRVATEIAQRAPETIAITLLHSYADASHERQLRDALIAHIETRADGSSGFDVDDIVCSHDVFPEIREYERMATTVAEAYARPAVRRYLRGLETRLQERKLETLRIMTSAGGTLDASSASLRAAALALSGPAGGVTGASAVLRALNIGNALTIDIGGTSADVSLILDGEPLVERGGMVAGVPIALPRVLVEAVAAGGGSVGWIDAGGALRAGPHSAGASPGPASYGRGGIEPTITDAHVVLGHIPEGDWSGGVHIDVQRARTAMATLADKLDVTVERAADALIATADATMARALRRISVDRGIDPRDVTLVAFGGGGPLHACGLAERLGMERIVVPPHAGVLSAVGLALAPDRREALAGFIARPALISADELSAMLIGQEQRLRMMRNASAGEHVSGARWWLRMRYEGQGHELDVAVAPGESGDVVSARFVELHRARTGFVLDREAECISVRTALVGEAWPVRFARRSRAGGGSAASDAISAKVTSDAGGARSMNTRATVLHDTHDRAIFDDGSERDMTLDGSAIVRLADATMHVASGWRARALPIGGWLMERV